jgi:RimJ/RimL family protein N-acetyltransferase
VNYALDELKLKEISAYVFPDNNSLIRILEKMDLKRQKR